jgi:hypothetical protein
MKSIEQLLSNPDIISKIHCLSSFLVDKLKTDQHSLVLVNLLNKDSVAIFIQSLFDKRVNCRAWGSAALWHNLDADAFQSIAKTGGSSLFAIAGPAHPAHVLGMYLIINIKKFCIGTG